MKKKYDFSQGKRGAVIPSSAGTSKKKVAKKVVRKKAPKARKKQSRS